MTSDTVMVRGMAANPFAWNAEFCRRIMLTWNLLARRGPLPSCSRGVHLARHVSPCFLSSSPPGVREVVFAVRLCFSRLSVFSVARDLVLAVGLVFVSSVALRGVLSVFSLCAWCFLFAFFVPFVAIRGCAPSPTSEMRLKEVEHDLG